MKFTQTSIQGAYIVELEKREDERGFLARTWDRQDFEKHGIAFDRELYRQRHGDAGKRLFRSVGERGDSNGAKLGPDRGHPEG